MKKTDHYVNDIVLKSIMHIKVCLAVFIFFMPHCVFLSGKCPNLRTDVKSIRKRRYVVFPDGSDAVCTIDFAKSFHTHVPSGWYMTMDMDMIYPLPDSEMVSKLLRKKLHHRQKRELWERMKNALNLRNMNGHACLLRSICEAKVYLAPPGRSLVHDLLRAILTAPLEDKEFAEEIGEEMYSELSNPNFCERVPDCPFSLLQFFLGFNEKKK